MTPIAQGFESRKKFVGKNRFQSRNLLEDSDQIMIEQLSLDKSNDTNWYFISDLIKGFRDPQIDSA